MTLMETSPRVSLDQWRVFHAVVDAGGFAQAARMLHRSQSSVSYTIRRLQEILDLPLFEMQGRRAVLTGIGQAVLERSRSIVEQAVSIETAAQHWRSGCESSLRIVVENLLAPGILYQAMQGFSAGFPHTRIHLREEVLSGVQDLLEAGEVDLAISPTRTTHHASETLVNVSFMAVTGAEHELQKQAGPIGLEKLREQIHIVIRDSGRQPRDAGWLESENKWTVSSFTAARELVEQGLGFSWLPRGQIAPSLRNGTLKALHLDKGGIYEVPVYLVYGQPQAPGPALQYFIDQLLRAVKHHEKH